MRTASFILASVVANSALLGGADEPRPRAGTDEIYVIGKELIQLLESDPDAVVLVGEQARKYLEAARARDRGAAAAVVPQQCTIRAELDDELAGLQIELTVRSDRPGRNPVPLGLGEGHLVSASIDGGTPFLTLEQDKWLAWVDGPGSHTISVTLRVMLGGSKSLPALVCSIPEAPVTSLELRSRRPVGELKLSPATPITLRAKDSPSVFDAALGPRSKLDLRWRWADEPKQEASPLLRAASEVTASVEAGVVQLRTELRLQVLRGALQACELRLGADERILDLQKADRSVIGWQASVEGAEQRVFVHFAEPLTRNADLLIDSELPISGESRPLRGITVVGAYSHRGLLVLRCAAELDVAVSDVVNARRTAALPATLRSPRNELALAGFAQPVQAKLSILPRRTSTSVRSASLLACDGETARVFTRWQFAVQSGTVSQVDFYLPEPFQTGHFVYTDDVQTIREESVPDGRIARVYLKGTPDEFELRLRAAVPQVFARNLAKLDLPYPRAARNELSRLFVAGSDEITIEPTPDLVASNEPLDAVLARELPAAEQPVRAFQSRSMLDRVAFRLARRVPAIRSLARTQVNLDADFTQVQQTFEIASSGAMVRQLRFNVPESLRGAVQLAAGPWQIDESVPTQDLVLRLDGETADATRVQLSYQMPRVPAQPRTDSQLVIPLLRNLDGPCDASEVRIFAPRDVLVRVPDVLWHRVPAQPAAAGDKPRLTVRRMDAADSIALNVSHGNPHLSSGIWVDRALIETTVAARGEWYTRARYRIAELELEEILIHVPTGARVTRIRWDDQPVTARPGSEPDRIRIDELPQLAAPAILDIELSNSATPSDSVWSILAWQAPELVGNVALGEVRWRIALPDDLAIVRGPARYADENEVRWLSAPFRLTPSLSSAELENWIGGKSAGESVAELGDPVLYSRLLSIVPMSVECMNRPMLILSASGALMVLGLAVVVSPRRIRILLLGGAALVCTTLTVWEPTAMLALTRSAGLGAMLVAVATVTHLWLLRQAAPRRTVFPEAAMLARIQQPGIARSSDFELAGGPARTVTPYDPRTSVPEPAGGRSSALSK